MKAPCWTAEEDAALRAGWVDPTVASEDIAAALGRSRYAARHRARKLRFPPKAIPKALTPKLLRTCEDAAAFEVPGAGGDNIVLVDQRDAVWFAGELWYVHAEGHGYYVYSHAKPTKKLHRVVLQAPDETIIDHVNRNGLDNRRSNLRLVDAKQNNHNSGPRCHARSKFKGVWYHRSGRFHGVVKGPDGHRYSIGYHDNEEDAARAHDALARLFRGEFAYLNFPDKPMPLEDIMAQPSLRACYERFAA